MKKLLGTLFFALLAIVVAYPKFAVSSTQEEKRQALVRAELDKFEHRVLKFDASSLSGEDKTFLKLMLQAADLVEEINMLQINAANLKYEDEVNKSGSEFDKTLFHRNQGPWCLDNDEKLCNTLKSQPPKRVGWDFWPDDMKEETLAEFERMPNARELLSPFTYVKKVGPDKYEAVPFASSPVLAEHISELSGILREASNYADGRSLRKFLRSRARAIKSQSAFPYDGSDFDWIDLKGPWEITVGPYETYKEPMKRKAQFEMYVAREDPTVNEKLKVFKSHLQDFENHFATLADEKIYKPKKLDSRIPLRAVQLIYASGDGRSPKGATIAYHLPNQGRSVDKGLYKKVFLINHMELFEPLSKKRAKLSLIPSQAKLVDGWSSVMNTTFHEFAHGFGAHRELPIVDVKGNKTTVGEALGPMGNLMEELKADVASLWFVPYLVEKGLMNKDEVGNRYASAVLHKLGLLQYALKGTYPQMAAIEVGNLMENGALTYDERKGFFTIHLGKFHEAVSSLMHRIVTIQFTGDRDGAKNLRAQCLNETGEDQFEYGTLLDRPMKRIKAAFDAAELKSFAIDYEVTGL